MSRPLFIPPPTLTNLAMVVAQSQPPYPHVSPFAHFDSWDFFFCVLYPLPSNGPFTMTSTFFVTSWLRQVFLNENLHLPAAMVHEHILFYVTSLFQFLRFHFNKKFCAFKSDPPLLLGPFLSPVGPSSSSLSLPHLIAVRLSSVLSLNVRAPLPRFFIYFSVTYKGFFPLFQV